MNSDEHNPQEDRMTLNDSTEETTTFNESKPEITISEMTEVGKYFESNNDYINAMKVNKKYKSLTSKYFLNPISDCSLFVNMKCQHFYKREDVKHRKEGMKGYVYWYEVKESEIKVIHENEV